MKFPQVMISTDKISSLNLAWNYYYGIWKEVVIFFIFNLHTNWAKLETPYTPLWPGLTKSDTFPRSFVWITSHHCALEKQPEKADH